ncbi:restriction endonuclease subunit S [Streptococcus suis]|nr:restriction endonuclease subunit S [Streptococcus suis]
MKANNNIPAYRFQGYTDAWELRKLNNIADVRDGTHNSPRYIEFGYPLVTSKNIKNGQVNFEDIQYISSFDYEEINKRSKVNINDILMGMIGTVGNLALVREEPKFAIKNVALIKNIGVVNVEFLFHYLGSYVIERQLQNSLDGGTQKFISLNKIRHLDITFPSLPEQEAIGTFFSTLDRRITLHQRKFDTLKEQKKTYLKLLFPAKGQTKPALRFQGIEDDWEEVKLGKILKERNEQIAENEEYPLMSFVQGVGVTPKGERYDRSFLVKEDNKKYKKTELGDFIYSSNNLETGSIGFNKTGKAVISPVYSIFYSKDEFESSFIGILSQRKDFIAKMIKFRQGVVYGQWRIHENDFLQILLRIPTKAEMEKIIIFFQTLDQEIAQVEDKLASLKEMKKTLLRKLFV